MRRFCRARDGTPRNPSEARGRYAWRVIQRPDELTEFLAIYWADALGPMQQRKAARLGADQEGSGARADQVRRLSARQIRSRRSVRIRDVLFMVHAKPKDEAQEKIWKQLVDGKLAAPDTWEVSLSAGEDKRETFERLIADKKLGAWRCSATSRRWNWPTCRARRSARRSRRCAPTAFCPTASSRRRACAGPRARTRTRDVEFDQGHAKLKGIRGF